MRTAIAASVRRLITGFARRLSVTNSESSWNSPLAQELTHAGMTFSQWLVRYQSEQRLYIDLPTSAVTYLQEHHPERVTATIASAETLLSHQFCLLGSGSYTPVDAERSPSPGGYTPIDWYWDPVSRLRFPGGIPHSEWDLYAMRPGNADIKLPWELARCQHWVTLGQAYRLTGESRYAFELAHQLDDFVQANPIGIGINWTCTMDVAIRALNWALGLTLIQKCQGLECEFWKRAHAALFEHGQFIEQNLENTYEVTSNHFLSNIVGLYYLACVFQDLPQGKEWERFCRTHLEQEIQSQVLDDGADYESSVPYHRLVTEFFLGAGRLATWRKQPLSASYYERLRKMVKFLGAVLRPDGLMPQIGDADDGRLHIVTDYAEWMPQDARHIFTPAALLLDEPAWLGQAGKMGLWEAAWWGFDIGSIPMSTQQMSTPTCLFPQAGLAVMRTKDAYVLVSNGVVGTQGFGNHKHNDQLGFEYHAAGSPLIVDPGSHVYTSNPDSRNLFRSTAYHNTLCIDDEEQNEMRPEWLFRLFETAHAEHLAFEETDTYIQYRGRQSGYQRLQAPVSHERCFRLDKASGGLAILDHLRGTGQHRLKWHFHCAPGVQVSRTDIHQYLLLAGTARFVLQVPEAMTGHIRQGWYSPSYGIRQPCQTIDLSVERLLHENDAWLFLIGPEAWVRHAEQDNAWVTLHAELRVQ